MFFLQEIYKQRDKLKFRVFDTEDSVSSVISFDEYRQLIKKGVSIYPKINIKPKWLLPTGNKKKHFKRVVVAQVVGEFSVITYKNIYQVYWFNTKICELTEQNIRSLIFIKVAPTRYLLNIIKYQHTISNEIKDILIIDLNRQTGAFNIKSLFRDTLSNREWVDDEVLTSTNSLDSDKWKYIFSKLYTCSTDVLSMDVGSVFKVKNNRTGQVYFLRMDGFVDKNSHVMNVQKYPAPPTKQLINVFAPLYMKQLKAKIDEMFKHLAVIQDNCWVVEELTVNSLNVFDKTVYSIDNTIDSILSEYVNYELRDILNSIADSLQVPEIYAFTDKTLFDVRIRCRTWQNMYYLVSFLNPYIITDTCRANVVETAILSNCIELEFPGLQMYPKEIEELRERRNS